MISVFEIRKYMVGTNHYDTIKDAAIGHTKEMLKRALANNSNAEIQRCYEDYKAAISGEIEIKLYPYDNNPHVITKLENL